MCRRLRWQASSHRGSVWLALNS
ncbi:hypothetical protein PMI37_05296, partial [Pseudomonas sp. GM80]